MNPHIETVAPAAPPPPNAVIELIRVRFQISLAEVRRDLANDEARGRHPVLILARESLWWTHQMSHCGRRAAIPPMFQTNRDWRFAGPRGESVDIREDWRAALDSAEAAPHLFGPDGLKAFLAAHHQNCQHPFQNRPWSAVSWASYSHALRVARRSGGGERGRAA